jgi:hypothetical protein
VKWVVGFFAALLLLALAGPLGALVAAIALVWFILA